MTNISRIDNQAMKFGQLIKLNRVNIFLEKPYTKCDGDATPRSKTEHISDQEYYVLQFVFTVCQVEVYWNTLKLSCRPLAFTSSKAFLKNKKRSGTSLPASFFAWFLKKNIYLVIFYYLIKFHYLVAFIYEIFDNMYIVIVY